MKISGNILGLAPVYHNSFGLFNKPKNNRVKNQTATEEKGGIYVKPLANTKKQEDTISRALNELKKVEFPINDVIYMQNLGVNLPFKNGLEAVDYLNSKHIDIAYADFSNKSVHACLDTTNEVPVVLINSNYKYLATFSYILALS